MITINQLSTLNLEDLSKIKLKRPENAGKYWQGIPHYELIWGILNHIDILNYTVLDKQWIADEGNMHFALSKDKADMVASLEISIPTIQLPDGIVPSLGIINSNSMKSSLKAYIGFVVKPVNNGIVIASPSLRAKHTIHLDLEEIVEGVVSTFYQKLKEASKFIEQLKTKKLSTEEANQLLIDIGNKKIMPWSRIGQIGNKAFNLAKQPKRTKDITKKKWVAWDILNAFSFVTKQSPPFNQLRMLNRFRKLLQKY